MGRWIPHLRAHGASNASVWAAVPLSWVLVALATQVRLPMMFPLQQRGTYLASGVVVASLLPVILTSRVLQEGPLHLVVGASRRLMLSRLRWLLVYLAAETVGVLVIAALLDLHGLLVGDVVLGSGLLLLSVGLLGFRFGWLLPTVVVVVATVPGLVPFDANFVYRSMSPDIGWAAAICVTAGVIAYAAGGSVGLLFSDTSWRSSNMAAVDSD